nr:MAG TPA: hypothetical protein [Bacteriophage sp.]
MFSFFVLLLYYVLQFITTISTCNYCIIIIAILQQLNIILLLQYLF